MDTKALTYNESEVAHLLKGCIDTHVHGGPDVVPRKMDDLALARDAAKAGMRGLVLKCHVSSTEGRAYLVQQMVPEVQVWGGIALNFNTGGLNPEALQLSIRMGAKIVWMPTVAAANHLQFPGLSGHIRAIEGGIKRTGLTIYDEAGKLRTEVIEILELIKEANIILATGHLSPRESIDLVNEALRRGVQKILFTHPEVKMTAIPLEEQKRLAARGVYFERCWLATTNVAGENLRISPEELASAIKTVGSVSTIMASDYGQLDNPPPVKGMWNYIAAMLRLGITPQEIELMTKHNPAQLLGL